MSYHVRDAVAVPGVVVLVRGDYLEVVYGFYESMSEARGVGSYLIRHHLLADDVQVDVLPEEEFYYRCSHHYYRF